MESSLRFINYTVDKIEFKNNYESPDEIEIDFDINSEISISDDNRFFVKLSLDLFKRESINSPFTMSVDIVGIFEIDNMPDEDTRNSLMEKNSIAILFPYVRAIVSNYTALANVTPLILPPINVVEYINRKYNKEIM